MDALVFVGFLLAVVAIAYFSWRAVVRRRQALATFAKQYGLQYSPTDPFGLVNYAFSLFQRGDGQGVDNVRWGEWQGHSVKPADVWYYDESTDAEADRRRSYHHYSVAVIDVRLELMPVSIAPEGFLSRLADGVGFRDIDFE